MLSKHLPIGYIFQAVTFWGLFPVLYQQYTVLSFSLITLSVKAGEVPSRITLFVMGIKKYAEFKSSEKREKRVPIHPIEADKRS